MATRPSESMTSRGTDTLMVASSQVGPAGAAVHPGAVSRSPDGHLSTVFVHRVVHIHTGSGLSLWTVSGGAGGATTARAGWGGGRRHAGEPVATARPGGASPRPAAPIGATARRC